MVLCQQQLMGIGDQCIAAAPGNRVQPLVHAAVDIDDKTAGFDGGFPCLNGDMACDDLAVLGIRAEFRQDPFGGLLLLDPLVVGILFFLAGGIVGNKVSLKGCDLVFAAQRGMGAAPQVPHQIQRVFAFFRMAGRVGGDPDNVVILIQHGTAGILFAVDGGLMKSTVLIHRDTAMIEQIAVVDLIDGAVVQQEFKVALQPDAVAERKGQIIHDRFLGGRKPVRILRRQGGEVRVLQVIPFAVDLYPVGLGIYGLPEKAVGHMVFGVIPQDLSLQFELDDRNSLMYLGGQLVVFPALLQLGFPFAVAGHKQRAGVVTVGFQRKLRQRAQIDAVAVLQRIKVIVADAVAQHIGNGGPLPQRRGHPQDIVVAPLDIHIAVLGQRVHDLVGAVAAVKDVTDDVQLINDGVLDQLRNGNDEGVCAADLYNTFDDIMDIGGAVVILIRLGIVQQFINDVAEILGHGLADFGTGVFAGGFSAYLDQMQQSSRIPAFTQRAFLFLQQGQLFFRIVDQRGQGVYFLGAHFLFGKALGDLAADRTGGIFQDVHEEPVFPMDIADIVLAPLG